MHEPTRMCAVCRTKNLKKNLTRYVSVESNSVEDDSGSQAREGHTLIEDTKQKKEGRGVYLCQNTSCTEKFQKLRHKKFLGKKV